MRMPVEGGEVRNPSAWPVTRQCPNKYTEEFIQ
jgi:hypothetical protein